MRLVPGIGAEQSYFLYLKFNPLLFQTIMWKVCLSLLVCLVTQSRGEEEAPAAPSLDEKTFKDQVTKMTEAEKMLNT